MCDRFIIYIVCFHRLSIVKIKRCRRQSRALCNVTQLKTLLGLFPHPKVNISLKAKFSSFAGGFDFYLLQYEQSAAEIHQTPNNILMARQLSVKERTVRTSKNDDF